MRWPTGNPAVDAMFYAGVVVLALVFLGLPLWALVDHLRPSKGEHFRPIGEAAPVVSEPAPDAPARKRRSPFAPKQKEGAK